MFEIFTKTKSFKNPCLKAFCNHKKVEFESFNVIVGYNFLFEFDLPNFVELVA